MELNKLYTMAEKENISIINHRMSYNGIITQIGNNYYIGINYSKLSNSRDEKEVLAEELGHYYCNALYSSNTSLDTIEKKEYRATKWSFKTLIPPSSIKELMKQGKTCMYEIAEELGVSEKLLKTAYQYYTQNNYM